jgi:hypothetical protein
VRVRSDQPGLLRDGTERVGESTGGVDPLQAQRRDRSTGDRADRARHGVLVVSAREQHGETVPYDLAQTAGAGHAHRRVRDDDAGPRRGVLPLERPAAERAARLGRGQR